MPDQVKVKIVKIGQGDCILVTTPGDQLILVDAGTSRMKSANMPAADRNYSMDDVREALWGPNGRPTRRIALMVMTHSDRDHYNKFGAVLGGAQVDRILFSGTVDSYSAYDFRRWIQRTALVPPRWWQNILQVNEQSPAPINVFSERASNGTAFTLDVVAANYLPPGTGWTLTTAGAAAINTRSVVLRGTFARRFFLLTGDATVYTENFLLQQARLRAATNPTAYFPANLTKIAHHGSDSSSSQDFVNAAATAGCEAVVSCLAPATRYKHPRQNVCDRWLAAVGDTGLAAHPYGYWSGRQFLQAQTTRKLWETQSSGTVVYTFNLDGSITRTFGGDDDMMTDNESSEHLYDGTTEDSGETTHDSDPPDNDDDGSSMDEG